MSTITEGKLEEIMEWKRYIDYPPNKHADAILIFDSKTEEIDIAYIAPDESIFIDYWHPHVIKVNNEIFWMPIPKPPVIKP